MKLLRSNEAICVELGSKESLAICYWSWELLARRQGDTKTEKEKLERALSIFTELGMPRKIEAIHADLDETNRNAPAN